MSPGNLELVQLVASWVATVPAFAAIVIRDERRLVGAPLERTWPAVSRDAAIFGSWLVGALYGWVAVVAHFALTRRSPRGALMGLAWGLFLAAFEVGVQLAVAVAVDGLGL